jgi:hypothetical protein
MRHNFIYSLLIGLGVSLLLFVSNAGAEFPIPPVSGLAWVKDNIFIAVHDAKPYQDKPRISLITLPDRNHSLDWQAIDLDWQGQQPGQDLESIAKIPNTNLFLIAESGNSRRQKSPRIFLISYDDNQLTLVKTLPWPARINNVEAITVALVDDHYVFLYAERADGKLTTKIRYCTFKVNSLSFGPFQEVTLTLPTTSTTNFRPVSAMEIDDQSNIYIVSAVDPQGNNRPFSSSIWKIGQIQQQKPEVILGQNPEKIAVIDGFKVEGLTRQQLTTGKQRWLIGTDDENYGGTVRILERR